MIILLVFLLLTERLPVLLENFALCDQKAIVLKREVIVLKQEVILLLYLVLFLFKFKFKLKGFS